jgi:hypothetical protein
MDRERRGRLALEALAGSVNGPDAPIRATAAALAEAATARSVVLVEGISDQIALDTLAERQGRDLAAEGVVIVPIGGAQAVARHLDRFGPHGADLVVAGLCDAAEEAFFRRGLATADIGTPRSRPDMERLGFFVCVEDLEDELIRAAGEPSLVTLLDEQGDLASFRTLQKQPAWRTEPFEAQVHRFLGAGARRKLRYARLLVGALPLDRVPRPLTEVMART